jgi:hypothetical protein
MSAKAEKRSFSASGCAGAKFRVVRAHARVSYRRTLVPEHFMLLVLANPGVLRAPGKAGPLAWQRFLARVDGCCTEGADALRSSPPPSATTPRAAWSGQQRAAPKTSLT